MAQVALVAVVGSMGAPDVRGLLSILMVGLFVSLFFDSQDCRLGDCPFHDFEMLFL